MRVTNTSSAKVSFYYNGTQYTMSPSATLDFPDADMRDNRTGPGDITTGLGAILAQLGSAVTINPGDQVAAAAAVAAAATAAEAYSAGTPSDWATSAPTTVKSALDRCAALLFTLHSGAIP